MRTHRPIPTIAVCLATAAAAAGVALGGGASASAAGHITGAGSSLVAPLVENVFAPDFQSKTGNSVTTGPSGRERGSPTSAARRWTLVLRRPAQSAQESACTGCIEIPWALAGTGLSYNLTGVSHLNLSGPVIADIFLGTITTWNDPQIQKLNKGETLPGEKITPGLPL